MSKNQTQADKRDIAKNLDIQTSTDVDIQNLTLPADTWAEFAVPDDCDGVEFRSRAGQDLLMRIKGETAYWTIQGQYYKEGSSAFASRTFEFKGTDADTLEIVLYS